MEDDTRQFVKQCKKCQRFKKKKKKCSKLPPKNVYIIHWNTVCIDQVGPYIVTDKQDNLQCNVICGSRQRTV